MSEPGSAPECGTRAYRMAWEAFALWVLLVVAGPSSARRSELTPVPYRAAITTAGGCQFP